MLRFRRIIGSRAASGIVAGNRGPARRFVSRFRDLAAKIFEIELIVCSERIVEAIGVITVIEKGRIHTEPRPNHNGPPLSRQSAHPLKVHLLWPAAPEFVSGILCSATD